MRIASIGIAVAKWAGIAVGVLLGLVVALSIGAWCFQSAGDPTVDNDTVDLTATCSESGFPASPMTPVKPGRSFHATGDVCAVHQLGEYRGCLDLQRGFRKTIRVSDYDETIPYDACIERNYRLDPVRRCEMLEKRRARQAAETVRLSGPWLEVGDAGAQPAVPTCE